MSSARDGHLKQSSGPAPAPSEDGGSSSALSSPVFAHTNINESGSDDSDGYISDDVQRPGYSFGYAQPLPTPKGTKAPDHQDEGDSSLDERTPIAQHSQKAKDADRARNTEGKAKAKGKDREGDGEWVVFDIGDEYGKFTVLAHTSFGNVSHYSIY
jgi:hypothetical protein